MELNDMEKDFTTIVPRRYHNVSYENDVKEEVKDLFIKQIRKRGSLYIYGGAGVGKTHLACAMAKFLLKSGLEVKFYNTSDFLEKLREDFKRDYDDDEEGLFRDIMNFEGVLILDDLGAESVTDWVLERLYLIINKKYEDMVPIIFTSNCDLEVLTTRMGDRVSTRISEMSEIVWLTGPNKRLEQNMNIQNHEDNK